jgi:glutathione S-transferase
MTIIVHHLDKSRSHRILWLLEELAVPYEIKEYKRDKETMLAPPELKLVHPLGKSPVLENTETKETIAESGAIVEVLLFPLSKQRSIHIYSYSFGNLGSRLMVVCD